MSRENVQLLRRGNAAFNAHDIEAYLSLLDPEVELVDHMGAVGEESLSGIEALRRHVEGWFEVFPDFRADTREFIDEVTGSYA